MIKRLCLIAIASLTLALGLHLAGPISTSHAVAPIGPSATMKIGCPAKKAGAKTRRCPRNPNVVAAAVLHAGAGVDVHRNSAPREPALAGPDHPDRVHPW